MYPFLFLTLTHLWKPLADSQTHGLFCFNRIYFYSLKISYMHIKWWNKSLFPPPKFMHFSLLKFKIIYFLFLNFNVFSLKYNCMAFYFLFLSIHLNSYQNITSMSLITLSNLQNLKTEVGLELQIWRGKWVQYRRRWDEEQLTLKLC